MKLSNAKFRNNILKLARINKEKYGVYAKYLQSYDYDVAGAVDAMSNDPSFASENKESLEKQYLTAIKDKSRIEKYLKECSLKSEDKVASTVYNVLDSYINSFNGR